MIGRLLTWLGLRPCWREVPPLDPLQNDKARHGEHAFEFVSRHAIAETGLVCPRCNNEAAPLGVFRRVERCRLGEVVACEAQREVNDELVPCGALLLASPDTEHGDHLLWDQTPEAQREVLFYRFVRRAQAEAEADRFVDLHQAPADPQRPVPELLVGETYLLSDGAKLTVTRTNPNSSDPVYGKWVWGRRDRHLVDPVDIETEWPVSPDGKVRLDYVSPVLANHKLRVLSKA